MVATSLPWLTVQLGDVVPYGKTEKCELSDVTGDTWILELEDIEKDSSKIIQRLDASARPFKSTKNKFSKGDVLYGKLRPYLNKVVIADNSGVCSTEIIPLNAEPYIDNRYLFYWLKTKIFLDFVNSVSYGVNMPRLGTKDGLVAPFVVAPLAEQKVIADKLDTLLVQVENTKARLERILNTLKTFRQSVLVAAVSGKLTSEISAEEIVRDTIKFENILKDKKHLSYGVLKPGDFDPNGVPMLRVMDIGEWGQYNDTDIFKISKDLSKEFKRTIVEAGDIVLSVMATIGRPAIIPPKFSGANVNRALAVIKLKNDIVPEYIQLQLLSPNFQSAFVDKQIGSAQKRINLSDLRQFDIWVPNISTQTEIVRHMENLFAFADSIEHRVKAALERVNNLTQSILAKAFRGELTAEWRVANPELINGDNSAKAVLEKIKAEREAIKSQPRPQRSAVEKKTGNNMSKPIKVVEALKQAGEPLSGQQLLGAAGYASDSSTEQLEQFFLDIRDALTIEKTIVKLKRSDDGQDWFTLAKIATNE